MVRYILSICLILLVFQQETFAQGCPSNIPTSIVKGPDSTETNGEQTFRSLVVNPKNPNVVYVGTEGNGVFKSIDGGATWEWLRAGMKHFMDQYPETYCLAINPIDTTEIAMAMNAGPSGQNNTPAGIYMSSNSGNYFNQRNCGITNSGSALVWYDELHPDTVFAASSGGESSQNGVFYPTGIYRSINKGLNWSSVNFPSNADSSGFFRVVKHGNNSLMYLYTRPQQKSKGFIHSTDGGATWTYLPNPLSGKIIAEYDATPTLSRIYAVPRDSNVLYYSADTGKHWTRYDFEINSALSIYPGAPDTILFDHGGTLVRSTTGMLTPLYGAGYTDIINTNKVIEKIVYAPSNPRIIYMSTRGYKVYKSIDGGHHFTLITRLRDSIEKFQNIVPNVILQHGSACKNEQVQLSVINNRTDYSIINCNWSGDSNMLHMPGIQISWVFTSQNKFGTFPISAQVMYDNGETKIFYDTVYINRINPIANFTIQLINHNTLRFNSDSVSNANYFWDFGDGNFDSVRNPIHTYSTNGNYLIKLKVTDKKTLCASNFQNTYSILINGVNKYSSENFVKVYPNPATNKLSIESTIEYDVYTIFNLLREKIISGKFQEEIDINNLSVGMYILQIENNTSAFKLKFVKE
jgi:hypothetical protein